MKMWCQICLLSYSTFAVCRYNTEDGIHYNNATYDAAAQIVFNALRLKSDSFKKKKLN